MHTKPLALIGMMGCGKSSLGKALADKMSCQHIDLDEFISNQQGIELHHLIQRSGWDNFRILENSYLKKLLPALSATSVLSLGGGTLCHTESQTLVFQHCTTIFLQTSPEILQRRLMLAPGQRPLLAELNPTALLQKLHSILEQRLASYSQASYTINTDQLSIDELCQKIFISLNL